MIIPPVPKGHAAEVADSRASGPGCRAACDVTARVPFGRALQSDHAETFTLNASDVPIDSADFVAGAWTGASMRRVHAYAARLAAPARG